MMSEIVAKYNNKCSLYQNTIRHRNTHNPSTTLQAVHVLKKPCNVKNAQKGGASFPCHPERQIGNSALPVDAWAGIDTMSGAMGVVSDLKWSSLISITQLSSPMLWGCL